MGIEGSSRTGADWTFVHLNEHRECMCIDSEAVNGAYRCFFVHKISANIIGCAFKK